VTGLDWRQARVGPLAPCGLCGELALCRHPDTGEPCHKTCADLQATAASGAAVTLARAAGPVARRVLVSGSRTWTDTSTIASALAEAWAPGAVLVSGGCPRGVDAIAEQIWSSLGGTIERHPADWATGRGAGPARNSAMAALGADVRLAFIRDASPGATHSAAAAERAGIPVRRYTQPVTAMPGPAGDVGALAAGLGYITRGWPVFVLGRSKRPVANCPACQAAEADHDRAGCGCLTCHGFYAATSSPARLTAMLAAVPGGLLAIRTGAASGLCVVDIDPRNDGQLDPALMTPTATVATGGGGWHLYYCHPGVPTAAVLPGRAGVDIKSDGGYVAAPPSVHPGTRRPYRWVNQRPVAEMPPALLQALTPPPPAAPPPVASPAALRRAGGISDPAALLAAHLAAVANALEGRRRTTLYGAARGIARMVAAGAITEPDARAALTAAGLAAHQTQRDIRAAITGAFHDEGAAA
jgi:hypothetical protein